MELILNLHVENLASKFGFVLPQLDRVKNMERDLDGLFLFNYILHYRLSNMKEKHYVYIGEHYDVNGRQTHISDKKIGRTKNPSQREVNWSKTKSPILYRHIKVYEVDDMYKVEKMLHGILNSKNTNGEWFEDNDETLVNDFCSFMDAYGGKLYDYVPSEIKTNNPDDRLQKIVNKIGETQLIRKYLGIEYEVLLTKTGKLLFEGVEYDTPNTCYNNGIVKHAKGVKGNSGTNGLNQFIVKETGKRLEEYYELD